MKKAALIMGSDSDLDKVQGALDVFREYGVPVEARILSAHRTPEEAAAFASSAREMGFGVILAAAGMAAHLAGALAARTTLPVIGIPMGGGAFGGLDALLSTVQMPSGIPVATVAVNGAKNAAILAVEILALSDETLCDKLAAARQETHAAVLKKDALLQDRINGENT
ncbi:MAG: 5-(carboxyamino)imidazole ribonucleotide mutase [Clostridia bacterium]|nr:5-(carboxyamino)imidazole ribonucleotide mutase [Clostridia bacterium]